MRKVPFCSEDACGSKSSLQREEEGFPLTVSAAVYYVASRAAAKNSPVFHTTFSDKLRGKE